jgi:hypothetical protein
MIELCRQAVPGIMSRLQGVTPPPAESRGDRFEKAVSSLLERRVDLRKVGLALVSAQTLVLESIHRTDLAALCLSAIAAAFTSAQVIADFSKRGRGAM